MEIGCAQISARAGCQHVSSAAINEMIQYYQNDETKLGFRLLWFKTFLERTNTVPLEEKRKVEERLDTFEQLLEQSSFGMKQLERGKEAGELHMAQEILI